MKRPFDWREKFPQLPFDKENKFKEGSWEALGWGNFFILYFWKRRK